MTGVKELLDFKKELELTLQYKPDIQTVLLVFNPMEPGIAKDADEVRSILEMRGIRLITVEVFQTNEFLATAMAWQHAQSANQRQSSALDMYLMVASFQIQVTHQA